MVTHLKCDEGADATEARADRDGAIVEQSLGIASMLAWWGCRWAGREPSVSIESAVLI